MKTVQEMAAECGIEIDSDTLCRYEGWREPMERFAALVRAQALDEAAEVCDHLWTRAGDADECADAIRALKG